MSFRFSDLVAKVRERGTWLEAFGWSDRLGSSGKALFLPGPLQVAEALSQPELKIAGLYRLTKVFLSSVESIHYALSSVTEDERGRWYNGKYSRTDSNSKRGPDSAYRQTVSTFIESLRKASPGADFEILNARLTRTLRISKKGKVRPGRLLKISNDEDRKKVLGLIQDLLDWSRKRRREGRPPDDSNILVYHVVNHVTYWKRARVRRGDFRWPDIAPLYDRRGRHKLERRWSAASEMLIWLHYHQFRMPWLESFIRKNVRADADRALLQLQKVIQRRYAHLAHRAGRIKQRDGQEGGFCPLEIQRIVAYPDKFTAWEL